MPWFRRWLVYSKKKTLSDKTAIAVLKGLNVPDELREYGKSAKRSMLTVEEAEKVAKKCRGGTGRSHWFPGKNRSISCSGCLQRY